MGPPPQPSNLSNWLNNQLNTSPTARQQPVPMNVDVDVDVFQNLEQEYQANPHGMQRVYMDMDVREEDTSATNVDIADTILINDLQTGDQVRVIRPANTNDPITRWGCIKYTTLSYSSEEVDNKFQKIHRMYRDSFEPEYFFSQINTDILEHITRSVIREFFPTLINDLAINNTHLTYRLVNLHIQTFAAAAAHAGCSYGQPGVITVNKQWLRHDNFISAVSGRPCEDMLMCLIYNLAHELIHIIQFYICGSNVGHNKLFMEMAWNILKMNHFRWAAYH